MAGDDHGGVHGVDQKLARKLWDILVAENGPSDGISTDPSVDPRVDHSVEAGVEAYAFYEQFYWNLKLKTTNNEDLDFVFDGLVEQTNDMYTSSWCETPYKYKEQKQQKKIAFPVVPGDLYLKKYLANPPMQTQMAILHIQAMIELGDMLHSIKISAMEKSVKKNHYLIKLDSQSSQSVDVLVERMDGVHVTNQIERLKRRNRYRKGMKLEPIMPTEANFLNKALVTINPCYSAEPFYAMGIEVIAVADMKEIYTLEQIPLEEYTPESKLQLEIDQELIELKDFLQSTLNLNKNIEESDIGGKGGHFLSKLVSAIVQTDKKGTNMLSDEWLQLKRKYSKNSLVKFISSQLRKLIKNLPHNFSESDLQKFIMKVLNGFKMWYCELGSKINITQFRHAKDDKTQSQNPYLEFYRIDDVDDDEYEDTLMLLFEFKIPTFGPTLSTSETWTPQMHNVTGNVTTEEDGMKSFKLKSTLLWKHTEAMFGKIMERSTAEDAKKMLQGGILVCNDRIRNIVLAMDTEKHRSMKNNKSARETMNWIFKRCMWARMYVDANEYHILEIINQSLYTGNNFGK